jgi:hypothetical protein
MFIAEQVHTSGGTAPLGSGLTCSVRGGAGILAFFLQLRVAKIAFVFVETVFFAVKAAPIFEFWMAKPASVFIPGMPSTP